MAPEMKRIVAVMGATGVQGGSVVRALSKTAEFSIRAVTRNPGSPAAQRLARLPNVTVFEGDMSQAESLAPAYRGAEAVFALTNFYDPAIRVDPLEEARQGISMADIAKQEDVKLFIWSTVPSALLRTKAKFDSPRLVENKFYISQYLKYMKIPHVDLNLGMYMENWINFDCIGKDDKGLSVTQPILHPKTKLGLTFVEQDLGNSVIALLKAYQTRPEILGKQFYCVSGQYSTEDFVDEIRKQTGEEVRIVSVATSGLDDLDKVYHYYNEWGLYTETQIPDPQSVECGFSLTSLSDFVKEVVVPFTKTLDTASGKRARGF